MTINDILNYPQITNNHISIEDYLFSICKKEIKMFYSGWELDAKAWIMQDNTVFCTEHGKLKIMSLKEIKIYLDDIEENTFCLKKISLG